MGRSIKELYQHLQQQVVCQLLLSTLVEDCLSVKVASAEKRVSTGSINGWREKQNVNSSTGPQNLRALFAPPYELMLIGTFEDAKRKALSQQKILLVNIQNQNDFASHCLNRDIWSDETVRQVISCSYIFWVTDINDDLGLEYVRNYNVKKFPHVALIDPQTGEQLRVVIDGAMVPLKAVIEKLHDHAEMYLNKRGSKGLKRSRESQESIYTPIQLKYKNLGVLSKVVSTGKCKDTTCISLSAKGSISKKTIEERKRRKLR